MDVIIREERPEDIRQVLALTKAAFHGDAETEIIEAITSAGDVTLSLVALKDEEIVGHIMFSPATVVGETTHHIVALGPVSVQPDYQREGIGSTLIHTGLKMLNEAGHSVVMLLGHSNYYPRFGFERADKYDIHLSFDVSPSAFMVYEMQPSALTDISGTAYFHSAFG